MSRTDFPLNHREALATWRRYATALRTLAVYVSLLIQFLLLRARPLDVFITARTAINSPSPWQRRNFFFIFSSSAAAPWRQKGFSRSRKVESENCFTLSLLLGFFVSLLVFSSTISRTNLKLSSRNADKNSSGWFDFQVTKHLELDDEDYGDSCSPLRHGSESLLALHANARRGWMERWNMSEEEARVGTIWITTQSTQDGTPSRTQSCANKSRSIM